MPTRFGPHTVGVGAGIIGGVENAQRGTRMYLGDRTNGPPRNQFIDQEGVGMNPLAGTEGKFIERIANHTIANVIS